MLGERTRAPLRQERVGEGVPARDGVARLGMTMPVVARLPIERGFVMRRSTFVGCLLLLVGATLVAASFPLLGHDVVLHQGRNAHVPHTGLDEVQLLEGTYTLWIEDIHPGFDRGEAFSVEAYSGWRDLPEDQADVWYADAYMTRTFDGVECELVAGFTVDREGEWRVDIEHLLFDSMERGDYMEVYLVRGTEVPVAGLIGAGIVLLLLGTTILALMAWPRLWAMVRGGERGARGRG